MTLEYLALFMWPIVASCSSSLALSLHGAQFASRGQSLQVFCISQAALLGSLLSIPLAGHDMPLEGVYWLGLLFAISMAIMCGYLTNDLMRHNHQERTHVLLITFLGLTACSSLVTALLPGLESHMGQLFFGDVSTVSDSLALPMGVSFLLWSWISWWGRRSMTNASFEQVLLGKAIGLQWIPGTILIAVSVQFLGLLYTLGMLFIPTTLARLAGRVGLDKHLVTVASMAILGNLLGFVGSVTWGEVPTVPTIIVVVIGIGFIQLGIRRVRD